MRRKGIVVLEIVYDDLTEDHPAEWTWHAGIDIPKGDVKVLASGSQPERG